MTVEEGCLGKKLILHYKEGGFEKTAMEPVIELVLNLSWKFIQTVRKARGRAAGARA